MSHHVNMEHGRILYDYLRMLGEPQHRPLNKKPAATIVLGSNDPTVALRFRDIEPAFISAVIVFTGNTGRNTNGLYDKTEAETFHDIARPYIPSEARVIIEPNATNTSENISFSFEKMAEEGIFPDSVLLVQKPTMNLRAYATARKLCPSVDFKVDSPDMPFEEYAISYGGQEKLLTNVVGNVSRVLLYSKRGHMVAQTVPEHVTQSYYSLIEEGFAADVVE
ncbi:YdcF family protein [Agrobacterium cavarae]|uniref:YdcF family protein n=1 Tax=Agrobacterium cavarae TaxID=2528239 RepID=UPI002FDA5C96